MCAVRKCDQLAKAKGLCGRHYEQARRLRGDPMPDLPVALELDAEQLDALRKMVSVDAAPLVLALHVWLMRSAIGDDLDLALAAPLEIDLTGD
jgi:hypothetical protein